MQPDDAEIKRLYAYPPTNRPWVRSTFVSTLDGAASGADQKSGSLGGEIDTRVFGILRSLADVVLVGAGTARIEGYRPSATLPIAIVSHRLEIPEQLLGPGQLVITTADAPAVRIASLRQQVEVIAVGRGAVDWSAVLDQFSARGWNKVLCEGGPTLHGELVNLDLIDELCLTIAPVLAAGSSPRIAQSHHPVERDMELGHVHAVDDVLLTRWTRQRT